MNKLLGRLTELGFSIQPEFRGEKQRSGAEWFFGSTVHGRKSARYGCFKKGIDETWEEDPGTDWNEEKEALYQKEIKDQRVRAQDAQHEDWEQASLTAQEIWDECEWASSHPYLESKGLHGGYGTKLMPNRCGEPILLVPLRDIHGKLWNLQRIYAEKLSLGNKFFGPRAKIKGLFHQLGEEPKDGEKIYVAEGFATACSIFTALGPESKVFCSFNAGNLLWVSKALRDKYPNSNLLVCADNDQWTKGPKGEDYNVGLEKAYEAAKEVQGEIRSPVFKDISTKPTDFNDLHQLEGLEEVAKQLENREPNNSNSFATSAQGPKEPDKITAGLLEKYLVQNLLDHYGDTLIHEGKDFFEYKDTHWEHMDPLQSPDHFKRLLDQGSKGKLKYKDIVSAFNRFSMNVPVPPDGIKMFQPNYLLQNFSNGTLELRPKGDSTFELKFRGHNKADYLTHCHPFAYDETAEYNQEFEDTLDRIWKDDKDREAKKLAYYEVLGACLVTAFRKLIFFTGAPKTGKSTLILFLTKLVDQKYRCCVDPTQFEGFNLETMVGKLLNFDTDINVVKPISDSILKKIEDRIPLRIRRKGLTDIVAPVPSIHVFGCNRMPVSQEGAGAYSRRALVFKCDLIVQGDTTQDFASHVWDKGPGGIVRRAIEGLKRLAANGGKFTVPDSSKQVLEDWKEGQEDLVAAFKEDLFSGEIIDQNNAVIVDPEGQILRSDLFEFFKPWFEKVSPHGKMAHRNMFYARCRELGIEDYRDKTGRYFKGLRAKVPRGSTQ